MEKAIIARADQTIIMPKDIYEKIYADGMYITLNKIMRSYGVYFQPMVNKKVNGKIIFRKPLGSFIIDGEKGKHIDHIDRNPLNNMPDNLRLASHKTNGANRLKSNGTKFIYKGIAQKRKNGGFTASVKCDGKIWRVGPFSSIEEAAKAYDRLAKFLFGEFASLNFPSS